jgi:hypothetical protein
VVVPQLLLVVVPQLLLVVEPRLGLVLLLRLRVLHPVKRPFPFVCFVYKQLGRFH